jgi:hypothetical protein
MALSMLGIQCSNSDIKLYDYLLSDDHFLNPKSAIFNSYTAKSKLWKIQV